VLFEKAEFHLSYSRKEIGTHLLLLKHIFIKANGCNQGNDSSKEISQEMETHPHCISWQLL
jgi:hypothetical protein